MNKSQQYQPKTKDFQVKLGKKYLKINVLYPSVNDTFVFLGMHAIGKDILVHCDKNGSILYQYKFSNSVDSLGMLQLGKVTVLDARANIIHIFDLSIHIKTQMNFNFMFEQSDQSSIITFSQTKLMCVVQQGKYNDSRFKLTYFNGSISPQSHPVGVYQSDSEWNYECLIKKGNENSMVMWYRSRQDQQFQLKEFHLEGVNPKFNHYTCPNTIGQQYGKQKFQIAILAAWQKGKTEFFLICITEKSNYNHENNQIINNNLIWNVVDKKIRETKFHFNQQYSQLLIDIHSFGKFSVFHTCSFHNGAPQSSPIYYLNNQEQSLAPFQRQWMCTYLTKMYFPSYQTNLYIQSDYQNADVNKFKMKIIQIVQKTN